MRSFPLTEHHAISTSQRRIPSSESATVDEWVPEDIEHEIAKTEPELWRYMQLLPKALWNRHYAELETIKQEHKAEGAETVEELRINYILGIVESREQAIEEFEINDPGLRENISTLSQEKGFGNVLQEVLVSQGHVLGAGATARVKSMQIEGQDRRIAVKYLLTPTQKTLSVNAEYDMGREVEPSPAAVAAACAAVPADCAAVGVVWALPAASYW